MVLAGDEEALGEPTGVAVGDPAGVALGVDFGWEVAFGLDFGLPFGVADGVAVAEASTLGSGVTKMTRISSVSSSGIGETKAGLRINETPTKMSTTTINNTAPIMSKFFLLAPLSGASSIVALSLYHNAK